MLMKLQSHRLTMIVSDVTINIANTCEIGTYQLMMRNLTSRHLLNLF